MREKSYKQRTYLDPIHGPIKLDLNDKTDILLAQIIDTKEFQRLRRIRQMGLGWFTFHGAEHTRFGHSLGALYIAKKMISHLSKSFQEIENHKTEILVSALIHDIGHGPFSHTSEKPIGFKHEEWTQKIIKGDSEINYILKKYAKNLPDKIIKTFQYNPHQYLGQIISSYVDCDRLDYLHRDSYYVGVPYGLTGSERIIESLEIDRNSKKLVIRESIGLDTVIHYLHARHSMYQQVYQHKKNLACDFLLKAIIERARKTKPLNTPKALAEWLNFKSKPIKKISLDAFIKVDDFLLISTIYSWANDSKDPILKDLSSGFIYRKLFKSVEFRPEITAKKINETLKKMKSIAKTKNLDPAYYVGIEKPAAKPYEPYNPSNHKTGKAIFIKQQNGTIKELSKVSGLVKALHKNVVRTCLIFSPKLETEIYTIKDFERLFR